MWMATGLGWFSTVKKKEGYYVRARSVYDLKLLLEATGLSYKIYKWEGTDYKARIIVSKKDLAKIMSVLMETITYSNFKSSIMSNKTQSDKAHYYSDIWKIMYDYQEDFDL